MNIDGKPQLLITSFLITNVRCVGVKRVALESAALIMINRHNWVYIGEICSECSKKLSEVCHSDRCPENAASHPRVYIISTWEPSPTMWVTMDTRLAKIRLS